MGLGRRGAEQTRNITWTGEGFGSDATLTGSSLENLFNGPALDGWSPTGIEGDSLLWTYRGALSIPGVARAAALLANVIGGLEFDAYTDHGREQLELIDPRPPLIDQPCPPDTRVTTLGSWVLDYLFHGNAMAVVAARDSIGRPTAAFAVPAEWCWVRRVVDGGTAPLGFAPIPAGIVEYSVAGVPYLADDIIHIKGLCAPGALRGFGVLEQHLRHGLRTAHEQQRQSQNMSRHGVPPGFLRVVSDSAEANDPTAMRGVKDQWMADRDRGGVAMLNNAVDFTPIAWTPDNMQMIQARQLNLLEVANIMGVPPSKIGAQSGGSMHYSTSEQDSMDLIKESVSGILQRFEQAFSLLYPRGTVVKADLTALLRADTLTRYQAYNLAIVDGWLKRSEVRTRENLPPISGIDDEPPTGGAAKLENKTLPIDIEGLKQVTVADLAPGQKPLPGAKTAPAAALPAPAANAVPTTPAQAAPVQATARRLDGDGGTELYRAVSRLEFKPGTPLWRYWTVGEGFAKWSVAPTPWTALRDLLLKEHVPVNQVNGLATNIMQATPLGRALFNAHHKGGGH